jgi:tetratricopeptide (TPR) repeat protein/predicted Ser/Thr protein kinase
MSGSSRRCPACGATFADAAVATIEVPFDTTGLPPGATFGASTGMNSDATIDLGATMAPGMDYGPTMAPGLDPGATDGAAIGGGASAGAPTGGPLRVGQSFSPRYHIIKLLGVGGMGAVYQAWDAELGVAVALKVIRTDSRKGTASPEAEKRFKQEILLARQVTHRNVVRIHDLGNIDGIKYITMPFVKGEDLSTVMKRDGKLPVANALRLVRQVAAGLQAAHEAGVVHRDLKPPNIMIGGTGDDEQALIMDFGISASSAEDTAGTIVGTLEYMSPEQGTGKAVDARTDIYAFGLILREMLAGQRAPIATTGAERVAAMRERFEQGMPSLRTIDDTIPIPLDALVSRCLERDPAARFQTTAELVGALAALDDAGELIPVAAPVSKTMMAMLALLVAALLGGTYVVGRRAAPVAGVHEPVSVLIADFDNRTGDTEFDGSLEQTLSLGVEGASFVNSYSRRDARKLLAGMDRTRSLNEPAARLVATREGIKVILSGTIEPRGGGYSLSVKGVDPADGKTLWTQRASPKNKNEVLGAIGSLAADVRKSLGDTTSKAALLAEAETFTTASLEAVKSYTSGQQFLDGGKYDEAIGAYQGAIDNDPTFGRAYAGLAIAMSRRGQGSEAEQYWKKAVSLSDRMTEREKYRTLGTYYLGVLHNNEKAIETYSALVSRYPADSSGHGNLGAAYFLILNFPKALEETRKAVQLAPKNILFRNNYILMAMYGGDLATAAKEADALIKEEPDYFKSYLPLAVAAIADNRFDAADEAYAKMARTGAVGAALATMGRADLAMYRGQYAEAETILKAGIAADAKVRNAAAEAAKQIALAETYAATGRMPLAVAAVGEALALGRQESVVVPAARLYLQAGKVAEAASLAADLDNQLQTQSRAWAKIIDGNIALSNRRRASAIDAFRESVKLTDFWMARFDLGITYVQAEHYAEALPELEACLRRRGEATAIFLDETPSFRYMATLPYWLARAQDGAGQRDAAAGNYKAFLATRSDSSNPLVIDARKRLGS